MVLEQSFEVLPECTPHLTRHHFRSRRLLVQHLDFFASFSGPPVVHIIRLSRHHRDPVNLPRRCPPLLPLSRPHRHTRPFGFIIEPFMLGATCKLVAATFTIGQLLLIVTKPSCKQVLIRAFTWIVGSTNDGFASTQQIDCKCRSPPSVKRQD